MINQINKRKVKRKSEKGDDRPGKRDGAENEPGERNQGESGERENIKRREKKLKSTQSK